MSRNNFKVVLREWSKQLSCPIFSIDYSLSPDAPFPEAFEECFYSYAWALKNAHFLGRHLLSNFCDTFFHELVTFLFVHHLTPF